MKKEIKTGSICRVVDNDKKFYITVTGTLVKVVSAKPKFTEKYMGKKCYLVQILNCPKLCIATTLYLPEYALEVLE